MLDRNIQHAVKQHASNWQYVQKIATKVPKDSTSFDLNDQLAATLETIEKHHLNIEKFLCSFLSTQLGGNVCEDVLAVAKECRNYVESLPSSAVCIIDAVIDMERIEAAGRQINAGQDVSITELTKLLTILCRLEEKCPEFAVKRKSAIG